MELSRAEMRIVVVGYLAGKTEEICGKSWAKKKKGRFWD